VLIARSGRVVVGDFGIAAGAGAAPVGGATEVTSTSRSWLTGAGSLTLPGALLGTPAYMAPEQMAGGEITPAVDVFAFCVALYEALHGQRPFRGDTIANLYVAIVDEGPAAATTVQLPRRLGRALRRGLAADPGARPASMHALLAELRAVIGARRRAWLAGGALAIAAAATGAGLWLASATAPRCSDGAAAVTELWSPARQGELAAAFAATGVVHAANTWRLVAGAVDARAAAWGRARVGACEATRVRGEQSAEVMDRRMACLDRQLGELDRLLNFLGEPDAKVVDNAVALVAELPAVTRCDAAAVLAGSGAAVPTSPELQQLDEVISHATRLLRVGRSPEALAELGPAIARLEALDDRRLLARALAARAQGGYLETSPEAQAWSSVALAGAMRAGDDVRFAEVAANQLGLVASEPAARELWLRLGEAALERDAGADHDPVRAKLLTNYGNALRSEGRFAEAEAMHREALALRRRDPAAQIQIADSLFNISAVLAAQGRVAEARPLAHEAIEIWERALGSQHPRMLTGLGNLALMAEVTADYVEADALATRALALARALRGEGHPDVARYSALLATIDGWRGDFAAARRHFDEALTILASGSAPPEKYSDALLAAASFYLDERDLAGAEALLDRALAVGAKFAAGHTLWVTEAHLRVQIALLRGDLAAAERELQRTGSLIAGSAEGQAIAGLYVDLYQAEIDLRRGRAGESLRRIDELAARHQQELRHPYLRAVLGFLRARVLWELGQRAAARGSAEAARAEYAGLLGGYEPQAAEVRAWLAGHPL